MDWREGGGDHVTAHVPDLHLGVRGERESHAEARETHLATGRGNHEEVCGGGGMCGQHGTASGDAPQGGGGGEHLHGRDGHGSRQRVLQCHLHAVGFSQHPHLAVKPRILSHFLLGLRGACGAGRAGGSNGSGFEGGHEHEGLVHRQRPSGCDPPFSSSLVDDTARVETGGGQGGEANGQGSVTLRLRDVLRRLRSNPRSRC